MLTLEIYVLWAAHLFIIGLCGVLSTQNNVLFMLMSVELMLLSANIILIASSVFFFNPAGQVLALFILTIAAAESAVGLALLILFYRLRGTIAYPFINLIKG